MIVENLSKLNWRKTACSTHEVINQKGLAISVFTVKGPLSNRKLLQVDKGKTTLVANYRNIAASACSTSIPLRWIMIHGLSQVSRCRWQNELCFSTKLDYNQHYICLLRMFKASIQGKRVVSINKFFFSFVRKLLSFIFREAWKRKAYFNAYFHLDKFHSLPVENWKLEKHF